MLNSQKRNGVDMRQQLREQLLELESVEEKKELEKHNPESPNFEWPQKFTVEQRQVIGMGIADARKKAGITQNELERYCDFKLGYMSFIELGKVATMPKALLKKIGHYVRNDFNELIKLACGPTPTIKTINLGKVAIALPATLLCDSEQIYKIKGPNFELKGIVDSSHFKLMININGVDVQIYEGKAEKNHIFFQAMDTIISKIKKRM